MAVLAPEQPYGVTIVTADDVCVVQMVIPRAFTKVPQHAHSYDHTTMVGAGEVLVERPGQPVERFVAGGSIFVPAGDLHCITSLVDNSICYCFHNVSRSGAIDIDHDNEVGCTRAPDGV